MRSLFFIYLIACPFIVFPQVYKSTSQGQNNSSGGAYTSPIVTHTYNFNSPGFQAPEKTTYSDKKFNPSTPSSSTPAATNERATSAGIDALGPRTNAGIYFDPIGKFGISDDYGHRLTNPIYDAAFDFSQLTSGVGYTMVKLHGKWGKFYLSASEPNTINDEEVLNFDDIRFKILEKK